MTHPFAAPDASADASPTLRARGPADLISAVPYLLGFHPVDSLVVVGLSDGQVVVTVRVDIDDIAGTGQLHEVIRTMRQGGADSYIGLVFDDRPDVAAERFSRDPCTLPWNSVVSEVLDAVVALDAGLEDVLLVSRARFWSYKCHDSSCCPPEGKPLAGTSPVAAAATYAGMVALPDRGAIGRLLDPKPDEEREQHRQALGRAVDEYCDELVVGHADRADRSAVRLIFALARRAESGELPDADRLSRAGAALRRIDVRDSVWTALDDHRIDDDRLLRHMVRELPSPYDAAPLFLLGWRAWRGGDGALARIAAERALASDPGYSAADILLGALNQGVNPRRIPRINKRRRAS